MSTINDTLDYLIKAVVTDPSSVVINSQDNEGVLLFEITAVPEIIGQIIGKEGKVIKSIRTILNLTYPNIRYSLEVKG
ncbi:KH domain-containing protein [Candidatus Shapirobacteria bacterium]|nr:KH domain-containing protein [Candidatus Shapirobacteria bacterium]